MHVPINFKEKSDNSDNFEYQQRSQFIIQTHNK